MMTRKVSKSSIKVSLFKLRSLVAVFILFFAAQTGWSATYYWVGEASGDWGTASNWNTALDKSGTSAVPTSTDIVYIGKTATIDIGTLNIAVAGFSLAGNGQYYSFTVTITGTTGKLTVGNYDFGDEDVGIVTVRPSDGSSPTSQVSNLVFNCNVDAQSLVMHSGGNVRVNAGKTVEIVNINNIGGEDPATTITVAGTLNSTSIQLSAVTTRNLIIETGGTVNTTTLKGSNNSVTNNGSISISNPGNSDISTLNSEGTGTYTLNGDTSYIWRGTTDTDWNTATNWAGGVPDSTTAEVVISTSTKNPIISSGTTINVKSITFETDMDVTVNGTLVINDDFALSSINAASPGTLKVTGALTNSAANDVHDLALTCNTLDVSASLECKSISVTGASTLTNSSDTTYLVARADDGITFGADVTVTAIGNQFVLGGDVTAASAVNVKIDSGMLNHVEENTSHNKSWSSNVTAVLQNNGCTFGMAEGTSYNPKVSATGGDVCFVGNGTFGAINDTGAGCNIHFGNNDDAQSNTFTFASDIAFNTTGNIVLDQSCSGLAGEVTLSGIKGIENRSSQLSSPLGVDISLTPGATIFSSGNGAGKTIPFKNLTFSTGTNTVSEKISVSGNLNCNGTLGFAKEVSVTGNCVNSGDVTFSDDFSLERNFTDSGSNVTGTIKLTGGEQEFSGRGADAEYNVAISKTSGNVTFTNPLTVNLTLSATFEDEIIFEGSGSQTLKPQSNEYKTIQVNKSSDTLTVTNDNTLKVHDFTITSGKVAFNGDVNVSVDLNNSGTATFAGNTTISRDLINESSGSITGAVSVGRDVKDEGGITSVITLYGTNNHKFTGKGDTTNYNVVLAGSGNTEFENSIVLATLDVSTNSYTGDITFSGNEDQTLTPQNAVYKKIIVDKTDGILTVSGNLQAENLTLADGKVKFGGDVTIWNGSAYKDAIFSTTDNIIFPDGTFTLKANSITTAGSIVCENNGTTSLTLQSDNGDIVIGGNIGVSESKKFDSVTLIAGTNPNPKKNISVSGRIYTNNINITCSAVTFSNVIFTGSVSVTASSISINGITANALTIDPEFTSTVKMSGDIILGSDFIIDYPLVLIDDTSFDITGQIIVKTDAKTGSIDSDSTARALTLKASAGIEIQNGNALGGTTALKSITVDSDLALTNGASFTTTTGTDFSSTGGEVSGAGTLAITGKLTNSGSWKFYTDISVTGDVVDTGAWDSTAGKELIFTGTNAQTFTPKAGTPYAKITLNKSDGSFETVADKALTAGTFTITACPSTTFKGVSTFDSFVNIASTTETIFFEKNATINANTTFNRPVTISGAATIETTSGDQTYKEAVAINADATFKALAGQTITFEETVTGNGNEDLTIDTANSVFDGDVSGIKDFTTEGTVTANLITITATTVTFKNDVGGTGFEINADSVVVDTAGAAAINTSGNQTYNAAITLKQSTTFTAPQVNFKGNISNAAAAALVVEGATNIDTAEITTTGAAQTYNGNVTIKQNTTLTASQINYSNDIAQDGTGKTLTINVPVLSSTKTGEASALTVGTLNLAQSVGLSSAATGGINLTATNITKNAGNFTLTNNADLTVSSGIIINPDFINGTGKLTTSNGATTFEGNLNLSSGTFDHGSGTVKLTGENKELDGGTGRAFNNLVIENSVTIKGSNSFVNLTAEDLGGKTIKFEAGKTQTVSSLLKLQGTNDTNMLNLRSTADGSEWEIKCTAASASSHNIQFVDVMDGNNISAYGTPPDDVAYTLYAMSSYDRGNNSNWNFPGMGYKWKGSSDATDGQKWYIAANWIPSSIPGKGSNVTIPEDTDSDFVNNLVLEDNVDISYDADDQGIITVNGTFDMADKNLTVTKIINNGLVRTNGVTGQSITGKMTNGNTASTVEYYGSGNNNLFWNGKNNSASDKQYENLHIDQTVTAWNNDIEARGDITIDDAVSLGGSITAATITTNAAFTYTGSSIETTGNQTYTQAVEVSATPSFKSTTGVIKFESTLEGTTPDTSSLTIETASSEFEGAISNLASLTTAATATFNSGVSFTNVGTLETQKAEINCAAIETTDNQIYNKEVSIQSSATLYSEAGKLIWFKSTVTGDETQSLSVTTADSQFDAAISKLTSLSTGATATFNTNANISQTGTLTTNDAVIKCSTITTTDNQTYGGTVLIQNNATLSSAADKRIWFKSTVTGDQAHSLSVTTADSQFDAAISKLTSLITGATATFDTNANISQTGTLATNNAVIKCSTIETTDNQTYGGTVSIQNNATLSSADGKLVWFKSTVTGDEAHSLSITTANSQFDAAISKLTSLTTEATVTFNTNANISQAGTLTTNNAVINCSTIETTDTQTYAGAVSLENNCSLTSSGDNISFASINGNKTLTLSVPTTKEINVNGIVGGTTPPSITITQSDSTNFNNTVTIQTFKDYADSGNITFKNGGTITAVDSNTFKTTSKVTFGNPAADSAETPTFTVNNTLIHTAGTTAIYGKLSVPDANYIKLGLAQGGKMTVNGTAILVGSFEADDTATFTKSVYLSAAANSTFGKTGKTIAVEDNMVVAHDAALTINAANVSATNIILYKGAVTTNANLTAGDDIVILGASYSTADTTTDIADEYAYNVSRPAGNAQWRTASTSFETALPDTTTLPNGTDTNKFGATLSVAGKTITAGKNFYANGTTLSGSSEWTLTVPDITNPVNGFAEAYFTSINNCKVVCSVGSSADGSKARLVTLECTDNGSNKNVDFDTFEITAAYTERDNVIRVEFNRPVRYHTGTVGLLKFFNSNSNPVCSFEGRLYSDPDCQTELNYDTQQTYVYIKASIQNGAAIGAWNTDATGKDSKDSDYRSSDRNGVHHDTMPVLDFPRALQAAAAGTSNTVPFIITDRFGKRLTNYSRRVTKGNSAEPAYGSEDSTYDVVDHTGPVLYSVRTGQELHSAYDYNVGESCEHSYDSHNFIEFRYSEPVDFDGDEVSNAPLNADPSTAENIQVTDSFGALAGNITSAGPLTIAGLGIIDNGLIHTGSNGSTNKYVNSLYRKDAYSIRLSVAGYTDGTVTDNNGYTYKKWTGYIEQAVEPTGSVNHLVDSNNQNNFVKDKSANTNPQIRYAANNTIPTVVSAISDSDASYGNWDISEPVFAIIRQSRNREWSQAEFDKNYQAEAIGNTSGVGSTLDRIEFHVYDNTPFDPKLTDQPEWFTEVGWCTPGSNGEKRNDLYKADSYAADTFGGARPFLDTVANRTSGGLRYSTLQTSATAFKYGVGTNLSAENISTAFDTTLFAYGGASSLIFTGTSNPRRSAGDLEGLYFALPLANTSYDIKTSFTVHYDETHGFITDLAGNRLRSKTISTIDRTPPAIDMAITPIGKDEVEIVFVKELCIESSKLNFIDNNTGNNVNITEAFEALITQCFDIISIDSSGAPSTGSSVDLAIDTTVPAKVWVETNSNDSSFTHIKMKLNRTVTLEDLTKYYLRVKFVEKYGEYSVDLFTQHAGSRITFIQDENGNTIQMYTAHALSDFAVGEVTPLYAYDSSMVQSDGTIISAGLWHTDTSDDVDTQSWAVHDWDRDQKNYGTLPAGHTVAIVADTVSASNVNVYLANAPDEKSVSTQANKDFEFATPWRIWLPSVLSDVFTPLSEKNNTNYSQVSGSLLDGKTNRFIFDVDSSITDLWSAGDQVSFLFGITNADGSPVTIMHSPELDINNDTHYLTTSTKMPLFALRQTAPDDFLSLDLWSFRLKNLVAQRGGVTILNNVIDSLAGEKVVVRVDLPQEANLTVLVMTLDGNIVDYLQRGTASKGEHYYSWDGSNRNGKPVARGMYFIRVMSDGIDETRKVLVVKE
ncbi:MAG: hypothetical protein IKN54_01320 [Lachnospiraceae bacterium]|nr:hypothetical protein [Lachnospiraceae bacterium]